MEYVWAIVIASLNGIGYSPVDMGTVYSSEQNAQDAFRTNWPNAIEMQEPEEGDGGTMYTHVSDQSRYALLLGIVKLKLV